MIKGKDIEPKKRNLRSVLFPSSSFSFPFPSLRCVPRLLEKPNIQPCSDDPRPIKGHQSSDWSIRILKQSTVRVRVRVLHFTVRPDLVPNHHSNQQKSLFSTSTNNALSTNSPPTIYLSRARHHIQGITFQQQSPHLPPGMASSSPLPQAGTRLNNHTLSLRSSLWSSGALSSSTGHSNPPQLPGRIPLAPCIGSHGYCSSKGAVRSQQSCMECHQQQLSVSCSALQHPSAGRTAQLQSSRGDCIRLLSASKSGPVAIDEVQVTIGVRTPFTEEKARMLRKLMREAESHGDSMYHSGLAERLA